MHVRSIEGEERVTPLELFFDLVFVFAITQVTGFIAANQTGEDLLRGGLLLAALWWAWAAYAWLTNTLDPEEGGVRLAVFASAAAMLIVALATPMAFGKEALVFAVGYSSSAFSTSSSSRSPVARSRAVRRRPPVRTRGRHRADVAGDRQPC